MYRCRRRVPAHRAGRQGAFRDHTWSQGPDIDEGHDKHPLPPFEWAPLRDVLDVPADFVPRIVGSELVRLRSQTVYYVLSRMKTAVKMLLDRRRAAAAG